MIISIIIIISCISIILLMYYVVYIVYRNIQEQTDVLVENKQCLYTDNEGDPLFINNEGIYNDSLCILNPLLITDDGFRESALSLYSPDKLLLSLKNIYNGVWTVPSTKIINQDPILANMILNPWFSSDDSFNSYKSVFFNNTINSFTIDNVQYNNIDNSGINLSSYLDKNGIEQYYLFIDNNVIIELPVQLYIGNLRLEEQQTPQTVSVNGVSKVLKLTPIKISFLSELLTILDEKFYKFRDNFSKTCIRLNVTNQEENDNTCKFFTKETISGIVVVLKRIIVVPMNNDIVVSDYITRIEEKNSKGSKINYLEFFLWLAMKSYRDNITYNFILNK